MNKLSTFLSGAFKQLGSKQTEVNRALTKSIASNNDMEINQRESHRSLLMFLDKALDAMLNKAGISMQNAATKLKEEGKTNKSPKVTPKKRIKSQKHTSPRETPQKSPQQKEQNQELLRQAQRKRLQLMQQLRKLDHKLDEIKKTQNHSRVMSNSNRFENATVTMKTEREKHEQALRLVRKLNQEKRQRELKKLREIEEAKIEQQKQLQKALMKQPKRHINKNNRSQVQKTTRQSETPTTSTAPIMNSFQHNIMTREHKPSSLPLVQSKFKETQVNRAKKKLEDIEVTIDPSKRAFPKSKIHYKIMNQEKMLKEREARQRQQKMEQLNRRNNYTLSLKNKVVLAPISLSSSMPVDLNKSEEKQQSKFQPSSNKNEDSKMQSSKDQPLNEPESIEMLQHDPRQQTEIEAPIAVAPQHRDNQFFEDDQMKS